MRFATLLAVAAATVSSAFAQQEFVLGFNSGASDDRGRAKSQADFEREFRTAKSLQGAPGNFTAIRLYSNIQWNTKTTPIAAFEAAIATDTRLLLGIWASGTNNINDELNTLEAAIEEHGSRLTDLVIGISVGSEDMYRLSSDGIRNKAGIGNGPDKIVEFIKATRNKLANTALANIPVTHVDTWTAWVNGSNKAVIDEVDFIAVNAFPFYENERDNRIENAGPLMSLSIEAVERVANGKDLWITETGWAYSGDAYGAAVASVSNAGRYWKEVGCALFSRRNVFWYTLRDANPENQVKFAITDNLNTRPRFDLSCTNNVTLPAAAPDTRNSTSATRSSGAPGARQTGKAPATSVSIVNSMAMALSVVFAFATFVL